MTAAPTIEEHNQRMNEQAKEAWYAQERPMPHISQILQGKYLNKEDVRVPQVVTVKAVVPEQFRGRDGQSAETKWIMHFVEAQKGLKLNTTNVSLMAAAFGDHTEGWIGKRVKLYVDNTVMMAGQVVGGVRIQTPRGSADMNGFASANAFTGGAVLPGAQPRFDPMTGKPLAAPTATSGARFDPHTGQPLNVDTGSGEVQRTAGPADPDFDDDIPF